MDGVKRYSLYTSHVAGGTTFIESTEQLRKAFPQAKVYVRADDFDAALAREAACREIAENNAQCVAEGLRREAALREELAKVTEMGGMAINRAGVLARDNEALHKRLTAAEQRNAELIKHLTQAHRFVEATEWSTRSGIAMVKDHPEATWNIDESKAALNHKPEAASHES